MGRKLSGRIKIPTKPIEIIRLSGQILAKHTTDGDDSILNAINDRLKLEEMEAMITAANELDEKAADLRRAAEAARQQRDILLKKMLEKQRFSSVFLKGFYKNNAQMLGDWGFTVDSSPQRKKRKDKTE